MKETIQRFWGNPHDYGNPEKAYPLSGFASWDGQSQAAQAAGPKHEVIKLSDLRQDMEG